MAGKDAGAGGNFGSESFGKGPSNTGPKGKGEGPDRRDRAQTLRQQMNPGILQGERIPEYRQRLAQQKRQAAIDAERKAKAEAAKKAQEEAAARQAQQQQRLAQEAAARQAAEAAAAKQAQEAAAAKAAEEARQKAEQQRLAAIEEQRRKDAEAAAQQRQAQAQALGTVVTTGPMASLNRPADPLPRYRGYTPMDYDASKTGSLTDQYARMLNVPFFQPFVAQDQIEGPTPQDSIFGIDSLMPNYTFDPLSQTASNPYFSAKQGGRVGRNMGGIIGFMDEPINIMYPSNQNNVLHGGISSILKKYKEIRSEL